jgi:hypothetical protein
MEMDKKKFQEMREHGGEATRLLKRQSKFTKRKSKGLISEEDAAEVAFKLNEKAVAEMDKAIELQKELIAGQDTEKDKSY